MPLKTRGYAHRIDILAQPHRVWTVLCGPSLLPLWMGTDAKIKPQQGGHFMGTIAPGFVREAMIDVFEPPRRLRLIYLLPPGMAEFEGAVVDDFLLDGEGEGTIVRLLCSGVPDSVEWNGHFSKARTAAERALARLKMLVEQRERMAAARSTT